MSQMNQTLGNQTEALVATQQITSSPTPDGRPAVVENTALEREPGGIKTDVGLIGEEDVWDGHYSLKNFLGQILWRTVATVFFIPMAIVTWNNGRDDVAFFSILVGIALVCFWMVLSYRILSASLGHHYRLTNRRLFVSSGILRRRQYQLELTQVKDVALRQTILNRWLGLGTITVVPTNHDLPEFHLAGVAEPSTVRDLIWHHARLEHHQAGAEV